MKTFFVIFVLFAASLAASGAEADGQWKCEQKPAKGVTGPSIFIVFDFKTNGAKLAGKLVISGPAWNAEMAVMDGRIDGHKLTFSTVAENTHGAITTIYEGLIEGDKFSGLSRREGGKKLKPMPFLALKQPPAPPAQ